MIPSPFVVRRIQKETYDTFTIEIEPADGPRDFPFAAGQFNMLYVFGVGEVPISLSGNPGSAEHTIRAVGTVTHALAKLKRGDVLGIRGPYGTSWPLEEAAGKDVLIISGGIGLAPLRPVLYQLFSQRKKYGKITLLYGAKTSKDILYRRELEKWGTRFNIDVKVTIDKVSEDWQGNVGVVTTLIPQTPLAPSRTITMICGPEVMMRFTIAELQKTGMGDTSVFISMERNMKCGIGLCGHCQCGPLFMCKDGPIFRYDRIKDIFGKKEL
ncbi:MAG: Oxidoreductase FAD/NAD(P)-binding domain protein [Candidatus Brocadiaceae bacterium]|nr:Oxidoreductase FAD/NAD(P)-binding domain protein [Candidatus Brocadiaceae bacterium]